MLRKIATRGCVNDAVEASDIPHRSSRTAPNLNFFIASSSGKELPARHFIVAALPKADGFPTQPSGGIVSRYCSKLRSVDVVNHVVASAFQAARFNGRFPMPGIKCAVRSLLLADDVDNVKHAVLLSTRQRTHAGLVECDTEPSVREQLSVLRSGLLRIPPADTD